MEVVGKDKYVVVKFYTRWCRYCRMMAPEYDKLFELYQTKRDDMVIARLEGSLNEEISYKYGISSFPMVVLFHPNDAQIKGVYQNQRIAVLMDEWIEKHAPALGKKKNLQILEEKEKDVDVVMILPEEIIAANNHTEINEEIEYLKNEILSLKSKMSVLEEEINSFKNQSRSNNITDTNVTKVENNIDPFAFDKLKMKLPPTFDLLVILAGLLVLIAAFFLLKKLYFKKGGINHDNSHHAKV